MKDREKERLINELDRRTLLWETKRDEAERQTENGEIVAKIDLQVVESTLKEIEKQKKELSDKTAYKHLKKKPTEIFKIHQKEKIVAKKGNKRGRP